MSTQTKPIEARTVAPAPARPEFKLNVAGWVIPLRYYQGWAIEFDVDSESFSCPFLCLFGFSNTKDLERAMDTSLKLRGQLIARG